MGLRTPLPLEHAPSSRPPRIPPLVQPPQTAQRARRPATTQPRLTPLWSRQLAHAELADVGAFAAPRALGVSLRAAGLVEGGSLGVELLGESVDVLRDSPALLERAHSLA